MKIEDFNQMYNGLRDIDKVSVDDLCNHPNHVKEGKWIKKVAAKRNILKHGGTEFICRECDMRHNNPVFKSGQGSRQTSESITVYCPHSEHQGDPTRQMQKACYYGSMEEPYLQICGSCAQKGRVMSEEQKDKIRESLKGRKLSPEHIAKILAYRENNPEWVAKANQNLIPGMGGGWNVGQQTPDQVKQKISESNTGKKRTPEQKLNVSVGRKKMLKETGGFTREHRENISKATVRQYQNGFEPKMFHLTGYHESTKVPDGRIYYASSYEKKAFLILDEDPEVVSYGKEKVVVQYFHPVKQIESNYLIDLEVFYKDGSKKIIEVKPRMWMNPESTRDDVKVVITKIKAAEEFCKKNSIPFEVWDENVLFGESPEKMISLFVRRMKMEAFRATVAKEVKNYFGEDLVDYALSPFNDDNEACVWVVSQSNESLRLDLLLMTKERTKWHSKVINEEESPIATDCPARLLEMTPKEKCSSYNEIWRKSCFKDAIGIN